MCNKTAYTGSSLIPTANYCYDTTVDSVRYNHSSLKFPFTSVLNNQQSSYWVVCSPSQVGCKMLVLNSASHLHISFHCSAVSNSFSVSDPDCRAMVGVHGFCKITQASFLIGTSPQAESTYKQGWLVLLPWSSAGMQY